MFCSDPRPRPNTPDRGLLRSIYSEHPPSFYSFKALGVRFYLSASKVSQVGPCTGLITSILGADVGPTSPSFEECCAFCQSHSWACTSTQNEVSSCRIKPRRPGNSTVASGHAHCLTDSSFSSSVAGRWHVRPAHLFAWYWVGNCDSTGLVRWVPMAPHRSPVVYPAARHDRLGVLVL